MPSKTIHVPKHIYKLIKYLANQLYKVCKKYDVPMILIYDTPKTSQRMTTGKAEEFEGRVEELADVLMFAVEDEI